MRPTLSLWLSLLSLSLFSTHSLAGDPPDREIRVRSVLVPGKDMPKVVADAVIDAAPAKLWAILSRCAGYAGTLPSISASKELSRSGSLSAGNEKVRCEMTVDLPWPLDDLTSISIARHRRLPKGGFERSWRLERVPVPVPPHGGCALRCGLSPASRLPPPLPRAARLALRRGAGRSVFQ